MKKIKQVLLASLIMFAVLLSSSSVKANDGHGKGDKEKFGEDFDKDTKKGSSVPIDGGLSLLLAAGVGLGVKKVAAHRKLKKQAATIQ